MFKKILISTIFLFTGTSAIADTYLFRDSTSYNLAYGVDATLKVFTDPIQANQPVYSWRTHTKFDGSDGDGTHNGELIGRTDSRGILEVKVHKNNMSSEDTNYCGTYTDEYVRVGTKEDAYFDDFGLYRKVPHSNSVDFKIYYDKYGSSEVPECIEK